jgi:hypothetical protein
MSQYVVYLLVLAAGMAVRHLFPGPFSQGASAASNSGSSGSDSPLLDHLWQEVESRLKEQLREAVKKIAGNLLSTDTTATKTA